MKKNSIIIIIVGFLIFLLIFFLLKEQDKTFINFFSLFGTYASLIGLIVAFQQIYSLNKTTELTKKAIENNTDRIKQLLSFSDISKATKVVEQIQEFIRNLNYEKAHLRMQDLKYIIIQASEMEELKDITKGNRFTKLISILTSDINNLSDFMRNGNRKIDFGILNSNLEEIGTYLIKFETKLKSINYVN